MSELIGENVLGGVLLLAIGVGFYVFLAIQILRGLRSIGWPQTVGEITRSFASKELRNSTDSNPSKYFKANVEYTYSIDADDYTSERFGFGEYEYQWKWKARRQAERYPVGSRHTVYYSPDDPKMAVLERGIRKPGRLLINVSLGTFAFVMGLVFLIFQPIQ